MSATTPHTGDLLERALEVGLEEHVARAYTNLGSMGLKLRDYARSAHARRAGLRNGEIASQLFLSEKTVGHHVSAILRKRDLHTPGGQAASAAVRLGIGEK